MNREEFNFLMKTIMEKGGIELEDEITTLQSYFDERENYNKEKVDDGYEQKYLELKQRYVDRFFNGNREEKEVEVEDDVKEKEEEKEEKEEKYDNLFKEEE